MKGYYYIGDTVSNKPNDLPFGLRIHFIKENPTYHIEWNQDDLEGPFESINQLKKRSKKFKELARTDTRRVNQILEKKNIVTGNRYIMTGPDESCTFDFIRLYSHSMRGEVKNKSLGGVHFYDNGRMKIKSLIKPPDQNRVWEAIVEVQENGKWFEKQSTFFPMDWSLTQLFHECKVAVSTMIPKDNSPYLHFGRTLTGVPVEIIVKDGKLKSIYPLYTV